MDVRFLGSGDAFGSGGRFQTCIALTTDGHTVLVDCGATSLTAMKAQRFEPLDVDAVVITHLHADHFGGLPFLVLDAQFRRRTKPLHVVGPPGTRERLAATMEAMYPGSSTVERRFSVEFHEIEPGGRPTELGFTSVRGVEVDHASGAPSLAVRVEIGERAFAYSGDTAWTDILPAISRDADLFAVEAYTFERPVKFHLDYRAIEANSVALGARLTVLTHMSPDMLDRLVEARIAAAFDGMTVHL